MIEGVPDWAARATLGPWLVGDLIFFSCPLLSLVLAQIRFVMAEALEQLEGVSQALEFEEAFAWEHEGPALLTRRALAQLEEGNREEAKVLLRRAMSPDCKAPQGWFLAFGYTYRIQRRPMEILLRLLSEEGQESGTEVRNRRQPWQWR